jgi:hypothetical protein
LLDDEEKGAATKIFPVTFNFDPGVSGSELKGRQQQQPAGVRQPLAAYFPSGQQQRRRAAPANAGGQK